MVMSFDSWDILLYNTVIHFLVRKTNKQTILSSGLFDMTISFVTQSRAGYVSVTNVFTEFLHELLGCVQYLEV